jgi:hypothetical protein
LTAAEALRERSREYELNALAADERAYAGDQEEHNAAHCFFTIALALRAVADVLTERETRAA